MTNEELIATIRNEIERQKTINKSLLEGQLKEGCLYAFNQVLNFLSTLESEKPMNQEELVEEVKRYYSDNFDYISSDQPTLSILTNIARHFTGWQKEQMLKEAAEEVIDYVYDEKGDAYKAIRLDWLVGDFGDKVRIIIVKEDEK